MIVSNMMNFERYKKPMAPPRRFFLGTCSNLYPSVVTSLIVLSSLSSGLSQVSVIAKRSMSASITWSIRRSVLFLIDRALTNPKLTGDVTMRRLPASVPASSSTQEWSRQSTQCAFFPAWVVSPYTALRTGFFSPTIGRSK